jgi:hypothetical protein
MNKEQNDIKRKLFGWANYNNLQLIIEFHNLQYHMMQNQISIINEKIESSKDKIEKKNLILQKDTFINTYDTLLKINTFLLMYSHLEEFLLQLKNSFDRTQNIGYSGSIKRFQEILKNTLKFDSSKDKEWELLCNLEKIRDCILHANSRVSLFKSKIEIERIVKNSKGKLSIENDRIKLSGEFLLNVLEIIETLIKRIEIIEIPIN